MEKVSLEVKRRKRVGKSVSKKDRLGGFTPAVIYGKGIETIELLVNTEALRNIVHHHGTNVLVDIIDSEGKKSYTTMIKELQTDHLNDKFLHADFFLISMDKPIEMQVPVSVEGHSVGVLEGGIVDQVHHSLSVVCLPAEMPDRLTVNIDSLELGESLRVKDIPLPPEMTINALPDEPVVSVVVPRGLTAEEEEAELEEVEGVAEEVPAEGEEEEPPEPEVISKKGQKEEGKKGEAG